MKQLFTFYAIRIIVTLGCILTLQTVIQSQGYRANFGSLVIAAIAVIIGVRFWMPRND